MNESVLILLGGLPGTGETTVARALAAATGFWHLRIDTLEQALVRAGLCTRETLLGKGYEVGCALAGEQLAQGHSVIADCVNPLELTRNWWRAVASAANCRTLEVEFSCSDAGLHRRRAESRAVDIPGLVLPTWTEIRKREYEPWAAPHLVLDTALLTVQEAVDRIRNEVRPGAVCRQREASSAVGCGYVTTMRPDT